MRHGLKDRGHRLAAFLSSLIYPSTCPACKNPSDKIPHAPICSDCWSSIRRYSGPSCRVCAPGLGTPPGLRRVPPETSPFFCSPELWTLFRGVSEAIHLFKFLGVKRLAGPLANLLLDLPMPPMDGFVPVSVTVKTLRIRGFNQTLLMAGLLSKHL